MGVSGQRHARTAWPPGKRPGVHCTVGWVVPRAGLEGCRKSRSHRVSIPGRPRPQRVAIPATLSQPTRDLTRAKVLTALVPRHQVDTTSEVHSQLEERMLAKWRLPFPSQLIENHRLQQKAICLIRTIGLWSYSTLHYKLPTSEKKIVEV